MNLSSWTELNWIYSICFEACLSRKYRWMLRSFGDVNGDLTSKNDWRRGCVHQNDENVRWWRWNVLFDFRCMCACAITIQLNGCVRVCVPWTRLQCAQWNQHKSFRNINNCCCVSVWQSAFFLFLSFELTAFCEIALSRFFCGVTTRGLTLNNFQTNSCDFKSRQPRVIHLQHSVQMDVRTQVSLNSTWNYFAIVDANKKENRPDHAFLVSPS